MAIKPTSPYQRVRWLWRLWVRVWTPATRRGPVPLAWIPAFAIPLVWIPLLMVMAHLLTQVPPPAHRSLVWFLLVLVTSTVSVLATVLTLVVSRAVIRFLVTGIWDGPTPHGVSPDARPISKREA